MYRRYVLSVLVENRSGVLSRISGLITRRGFNIDSLTVAETEDPGISRMTVVLHCDESVVEQMKKQLEKQVGELLKKAVKAWEESKKLR